MPRRNRAVTLIELIVAIGLISVIVLGLASMELFSRYHVISADRRAQLQNEASIALEHMYKHISNAIGSVADPPCQPYADNRGIRVRVDSNQNGQLDPVPTDHYVGYRHEGSEIWFFPIDDDGTHSLAHEVIANHIVITNNPATPESCSDPSNPAQCTNPWGLKIEIPEINQFDITVRARWDPNPAVAVSSDNPEVILSTTILAHSVSTH
jgi:type II secretory pathway pseudopilin PulG